MADFWERLSKRNLVGNDGGHNPIALGHMLMAYAVGGYPGATNAIRTAFCKGIIKDVNNPPAPLAVGEDVQIQKLFTTIDNQGSANAKVAKAIKLAAALVHVESEESWLTLAQAKTELEV